MLLLLLLLLFGVQFCEVITVQWLRQLSGQVVRTMLEYTDQVALCVKLRDTLQEQKQWGEICHMQSERNLCLLF